MDKSQPSFRDAAIGGGGGRGPCNFQTKQGLKISISNFRDIDFYGYSEIIKTRNLTIFTVYATIFEQFMAAFHFFLII